MKKTDVYLRDVTNKAKYLYVIVEKVVIEFKTSIYQVYMTLNHLAFSLIIDLILI